MNIKYLAILFTTIVLASCSPINDEPAEDEFVWQTEQFADIKIVRYQIPSWDKLSAQQQQLCYYLTQAGLSGRDMMYDQNYRHNLEIRNTLEAVYASFDGDKTTDDWTAFETYLKRIWFSNGIHHHYGNVKFDPGFSQDYFTGLCEATGSSLSEEATRAVFDPEFDAKKVEQDDADRLVEGSAINFYAPDITTADAVGYLASITDSSDRAPVSYKLNSRLIKNENGDVVEDVYKVGGLYGDALVEVVSWLRKAEAVAENDKQAAALRNLAKYYETGDLRTWDIYNINWVGDMEGDVDYINGFIEVYNDPLGKTGSYETIVQIKDFDASERMVMLKDNVQWFEDNSPIMEIHKKDTVKGVTYTVVNVVGEAGDASPSTPIGVNLPNADWIRRIHGSKSVSLGNILEAYDHAGGSGLLEEFAHDQAEIDLALAHGDLAGKLHTAMHEVIGHASGQLEEGAAGLENYHSTLEEGRADLVALYYLLDPKMVELGLMESLDVGVAEYDSYLRNGMLAQLRRLEIGTKIQEAHMRNRAWVSHWVYEQGGDTVVTQVEREGKLYYDIKDYEALRGLFGQLLREVQRIKSSGDFDACKALVDTYGVDVDQVVHQQVLDRSASLGSAPYGGFINPLLVMGVDSTVSVEYPDDFSKQMQYYSKTYSFLSGK